MKEPTTAQENTTAASVAPVQPGERIAALDVLRGFALLGILVPNIQAYSMVSMAYRNPTVYGDLTGANYVVWYCTNLFFEQKFMTLFSVLFGAGIVLMTTRSAEASPRSWTFHYRRMFWLLVFGIAHAYLLWFGDILFTYAVCGMVVYWLRKLSARWLILIGLMSVSIGSAIGLFFGWSMQFWPPEEIAAFRADWQPSPEVVQAELDAYRGSWAGQMPWRAANAFLLETFLLLILFFWRAGGLMLVGMALYKLGIITGQLSNRFYTLAALFCLSVGLPLVAFENQQNVARDFAMDYSFFFGHQINYWASLLISFGYLSVIMLVCRLAVLPGLRMSLAAVGRMALTNYIAHSVICTLFFYGHGLGFFGYLERIEQIGVVVTIWLVQLIASPLWLRRFRFGPLEWLWRSLVYMKRQPMVVAANQ